MTPPKIDGVDVGLLMLKPDGVRRGLEQSLVDRAIGRDLELVDSWQFEMTHHQMLGLWRMVNPAHRPITHRLLYHYLVGEISAVFVFRGPHAIRMLDQVKDELRSDHLDLIYANTVHSADSAAEVAEQRLLLRPEHADGSRHACTDVDGWSDWTGEQLRTVVDDLFPALMQAAEHGPGRPTHLDLVRDLRPAGQTDWTAFVPSTWAFGFDSLINQVGVVVDSPHDLRLCILSALAALYDDDGLPVASRPSSLARDAPDVTVVPTSEFAEHASARWCHRLRAVRQ